MCQLDFSCKFSVRLQFLQNKKFKRLFPCRSRGVSTGAGGARGSSSRRRRRSRRDRRSVRTCEVVRPPRPPRRVHAAVTSPTAQMKTRGPGVGGSSPTRARSWQVAGQGLSPGWGWGAAEATPSAAALWGPKLQGWSQIAWVQTPHSPRCWPGDRGQAMVSVA